MVGLKDSHRKLAREGKIKGIGMDLEETRDVNVKLRVPSPRSLPRPPSAFLVVNGFCDKTGTAIVQRDVKRD